MAKIKKIQEGGETIYPATITNAIKDVESGATLAEILENKANVDGTYPEMEVGAAYDVINDGSFTSEEISFRPSGGTNRNVKVNGVARIEKIKGNSVVANNCIGGHIGQKGYFVTSYEDGSFLVKRNPEVTSGRYFSDFFAQNTKFTNHKYAIIIHYIAYNIVDGGHLYIDFYNIGDKQYGPKIRQNGEGLTTTIVTCADTSTNRPVISYGPDGEEEILIKSRYAIDLTKMFGAGNEPTTVEEFYQRLPVGIDLSQYNEGEIINGNYGGIKTTGFNQFDGEVERGYIYHNYNSGIAGENADNYSTTNFRSKNFIDVLPNNNYFIDLSRYDTTKPTTVRLVFYDNDKNFISATTTFTNWDKSRWKFQTPINCRYLRFYISLPIEEYKNTNINLSWDTEYGYLNGTYQPYKPFTRDLSWVSKYFPNGMRSAGSVRDEIRLNPVTNKWEAVQNVGAVDLGTLSWGFNGGTFLTSSLNGKAKGATQYNVVSNILTAKYETSTWNEVLNEVKLYGIGMTSTGAIRIYDTRYSTAQEFKSAMSGVMLNYELATPTITEITEYINMDFDVSDYGTEELIAQEGKASAIFMADISYLNNTLSSIKQIPTLITKTDKAEDDVKNIKKEIDAIQEKNIEDDELEFYKAPNIEFIRPVAKDYNGYIGEEPKSIEEYIAGDYQIKISHPYYEKHKDECLLVIMKYGTLKRNINVPTLAENSKTYFKPRTKWNFFKGGLSGNDSILTINNTIDENGFVTIRNFVDKILSRGVLKWHNEKYFIVGINYGDAEDALGVEVKSFTNSYDSPSSADFITNDNMSDIFLNKSQKKQKFGIAVIKINPEFVDADKPMDINEQHNICWSNGKYRWLISDITPFKMHVNSPMTSNNTVNQHFLSISK